mmetsp:Transcript_5828/g.11900  ORF Transcript_5828/g.11900 Transcript_5828/m.11900 type:complete len:122 (-) Transcript_5828:158-523(-)
MMIVLFFFSSKSAVVRAGVKASPSEVSSCFTMTCSILTGDFRVEGCFEKSYGSSSSRIRSSMEQANKQTAIVREFRGKWLTLKHTHVEKQARGDSAATCKLEVLVRSLQNIRVGPQRGLKK